MALEGTIKDFGLPDIFQLIGLQRKTGTLTLQSDKEEVTVTASGTQESVFDSFQSVNSVGATRIAERASTRSVGSRTRVQFSHWSPRACS